ncbi:hypothetical protein JRO89_XS12G0023400 [Xanthoceras sorbifolium]|uniref:AMP-activated protein kinase glycogen-binding domain-containing protein n=1 Tax=Xanthoceras sorbifolium TaxID=99658 RepID=A0ABQ8HAK8_9ROSI|nr:hypothetical protein JRO89_XS12G0023400 [Xanthoceras sorbifolium]
MATLCHSHSFLSFTSHRFHLSKNHDHGPGQGRLSWKPRERPHRFTFTICACSGNKPSRSSSRRKVKSNEELGNELREFLSSVGFPEGHVPSMKELSENGRNDLANIVRRRGYKLIRELLTSSTKTVTDAFIADQSLAGQYMFFSIRSSGLISKSAIIDTFCNLKGQDKKVNKDVEEVSSSVEVPGIGNYFGSKNSHSNLISDSHSCIEIESSANSLLKERESYTLNSQYENVDNIVEDTSLSTNVSNMKNLSSGSSTDEDLNPEDSILLPIESSSDSSLKETDSFNIKGQHEKENNIAQKVSSSDVLIMENSNITLKFSEHDNMPQRTSTTTTLKEEVAKFIQNGDLDMIEGNDRLIDGAALCSDNVNEILNETADKESNGDIDGEDALEVKSRTLGAEHLEHAYDNGVYGAMISNRSALTSKQIDPTATVDYPLRGDCSDAEGLIGADFEEDLDVEINKRENQTEINHLKFMLHQKELELSRLKEQIEKEKHALSVLQTRAETEINKAQKLISEKGAELHDAEESLSGLEEVELQYSGDGEIVEVAGSFNGWHQQIKLDPQPSSSVLEPIGSRKSRLWSTVLWLYPGTYEIKFVVDGQWRIDPERESVTRGGISNNILRVQR